MPADEEKKAAPEEQERSNTEVEKSDEEKTDYEPAMNPLPNGPAREKELDTNIVRVQGLITGMYSNNSFTSITVGTGISGKGIFERRNHPDVICFGDLAKNSAETLKQFDHVKIQGHFQEHWISPEVKESAREKGQRLKLQEIVADKIEYLPSYTEEFFGFKGDFHPPIENAFVLSGIIINAVSPAPNVVIITLAVCTSTTGREDRIRVQKYTRFPGNLIKSLTPGKSMACSGYIESTKREGKDDGRMLYYENYVVRDIAVS